MYVYLIQTIFTENTKISEIRSRQPKARTATTTVAATTATATKKNNKIKIIIIK
jgi:hypothetical protein